MTPSRSAAPSAAAAPDESRQWMVLLPLIFLLSFLMLAPAATATASEAIVRSASQIEGPAHRGPRAYHAMCARAPELCQHDRMAGRVPGQSAPAALTASAWTQLVSANEMINQSMRPEGDMALHGQSDYWTVGGVAGDCEDYAIAKKQALMRMGWAADQLLYAVVDGFDTPYHAVLIVRTDQGDYVLDNINRDIRRWDKSGYRFVIRQSADNPHSWVRVVPPPEPLRIAGL
ncbi:MAG: transglutaminase-like cysteine peptidase [Pseudomonadota bacterium]